MENKILPSSTLRQRSVCGHFLPPVSNTSKLVMRLMLASAFRVKNRLCPAGCLGRPHFTKRLPHSRLPGSRPAQPNQTGAEGAWLQLSPRLFVGLLHMPADLVCWGTSQRSWGSENHRMACVEGMLEIILLQPPATRRETFHSFYSNYSYSVIIITFAQ